jgi:hypothetical protein
MAVSTYQTIAASQTASVLGSAGASGDWLERLIVTVNIALTGTVSIKDGAGSAIPICPASLAIGVWIIPIGAISQAGAWSVTTGAGCSVLAVGRFS